MEPRLCLQGCCIFPWNCKRNLHIPISIKNFMLIIKQIHQPFLLLGVSYSWSTMIKSTDCEFNRLFLPDIFFP